MNGGGKLSFAKSNGKNLIKGTNEKIITCDCTSSFRVPWEVLVTHDSYKYRCKSCRFIGDWSGSAEMLDIGWEHLDNSPKCVKFGKDKPNDSYLASRHKCRECGKSAGESVNGDYVHGIEGISVNGPQEYICSDCSTFGERTSYKHLKCKDWETNKKRIRDEAVYSDSNGSNTRYY